MQKLFNILNFSRSMRRNIFNLYLLLEKATELDHLIQISRRIRFYQEKLNCTSRGSHNLLIKLELKSVQKKLNELRRETNNMTAKILGEVA